MELQLVTLLVAIAGPVALWFGLGMRIGRLEERINGHRALLEAQIKSVKNQRDDCEDRHNKKAVDHEGRLRKLEGGG